MIPTSTTAAKSGVEFDDIRVTRRLSWPRASFVILTVSVTLWGAIALVVVKF